MDNIRHSSGSPEWYTPPELVELAREVLGGTIDVDPFSNPIANARIRALRYGSLPGGGGFNGFKEAWFEDAPRADFTIAQMLTEEYRTSKDRRHLDRTAFVNPPGDESGDLTHRAWALLNAYFFNGWIGSAFYVGFSLNQLQTLQVIPKGFPVTAHPMNPAFIRCIPRRRLAYVRADGTKGDAPSHPSFFLLMPRDQEQRNKFAVLAHAFGDVL